MANVKSETINVRIPSYVAKELVRLRDEKDLPTIGSALQFYIQQMKEDSLQKQTKSVANDLAAFIKEVRKRDKVLQVTCGAIHYILGAKSPWAKKLRKEMGCKDLQRCFGKDWPGAVFKAKVGTQEHIS